MLGKRIEGWGCVWEPPTVITFGYGLRVQICPPHLQKSNSVMCMLSPLLLSLSCETLPHDVRYSLAVCSCASHSLCARPHPDPTLTPPQFTPPLPRPALCVSLAVSSAFSLGREGGTSPILSENSSEKEVVLENVLCAPPAVPPQECEVTSTWHGLCSAWEANAWPEVGSWTRAT